jgi:hypothetical protein
MVPETFTVDGLPVPFMIECLPTSKSPLTQSIVVVLPDGMDVLLFMI